MDCLGFFLTFWPIIGIAIAMSVVSLALACVAIAFIAMNRIEAWCFRIAAGLSVISVAVFYCCGLLDMPLTS